MDESGLEDKSTDIGEHVIRDLLQSLFFEAMDKLEWLTYNYSVSDPPIAISC
jgi:hypothetical protein